MTAVTAFPSAAAAAALCVRRRRHTGKAVTAGGCVKTQIREIQVGEALRYTMFFTLAVVNAINLRRLIRLAV
ncbi:MAG TPA: hypothetical protein VE974_22265, partial [Thermoanaerobaculia bacterium]|nr:hypothetical protein [Thermoanaerobaculia bacterium]